MMRSGSYILARESVWSLICRACPSVFQLRERGTDVTELGSEDGAGGAYEYLLMWLGRKSTRQQGRTCCKFGHMIA